jgi:hypothetical protein
MVTKFRSYRVRQSRSESSVFVHNLLGFAFAPLLCNDRNSRTRPKYEGGFGVERELACYALLARLQSRRSPYRAHIKAHKVDNGFLVFEFRPFYYSFNRVV